MSDVNKSEENVDLPADSKKDSDEAKPPLNTSNNDGQPDEPDQSTAATASEDATQSIEALRELLEEANRKAEDNWEQVLRAKAEIENQRKRASRDVENAHKYALERFINEFLPVKDSMELGFVAADQSADVDSLKEGMALTLKMFESALEKCSIQEVNPVGEKFDPELHQAMTMAEDPDAKPGTVITVVQKGYLLNDRLIRPAMVVVAKKDETSKDAAS